MDSHLPRPHFGLDLLIAEAKRRTRRRRGLVGVAAVAAAAAVLLSMQPWGGGRTLGVAASHTAIAQIPGMTRVTSSPAGPAVCSGMKGTYHPHFCSTLQLRGGRGETWILTTAYEQGRRFNVSAAFARAHPGPVVVTDQWWRLGSPRQAEQLLRSPAVNHSYTGRPAPAANGGLARFVDAFYFAGQSAPTREIGFFWASGATFVNMNVIGAGLTVREAQQIALLARPR